MAMCVRRTRAHGYAQACASMCTHVRGPDLPVCVHVRDAKETLMNISQD